jgi:hypothetical protein
VFDGVISNVSVIIISVECGSVFIGAQVSPGENDNELVVDTGGEELIIIGDVMRVCGIEVDEGGVDMSIE